MVNYFDYSKMIDFYEGVCNHNYLGLAQHAVDTAPVADFETVSLTIAALPVSVLVALSTVVAKCTAAGWIHLTLATIGAHRKCRWRFPHRVQDLL